MADAGGPPIIQVGGWPACASAPKTVLRQPTSAITGCARPARIAQRHRVLFARAAAIAIAGAGGKEAAEDAVLGVEHRQVLIHHGFDASARRWRAPGRPLARRSDRAWA